MFGFQIKLVQINYEYQWCTITNDIGLFHLISIHPLWMTFNERPREEFEACPGGSKTDFNEGKGGILGKVDCVQG